MRLGLLPRIRQEISTRGTAGSNGHSKTTAEDKAILVGFKAIRRHGESREICRNAVVVATR